jgi:cytoskeletal protein RodZ
VVKIGKNQKGFGAVEGLLIFVIVGLIAFIGWYVWHSKNAADKTLSAANKASTSSSTTKPTTQKEAVGSLDDAKAQAEKVGNSLLAASKSTTDANPPKTYVAAHASDGQFTSTFVSSVNSGEAFKNGALCTNNFDFDSFTASDASISGKSTTVTLLQTVSGNTSYWSTHPKLTLVYANNTWSVDQYVCTGS